MRRSKGLATLESRFSAHKTFGDFVFSLSIPLHPLPPSSLSFLFKMDYLSNWNLNSTLSAITNPATDVLAQDLYKGVDPSTLNFAEQWWVNWYLYWGNPVLATGIMSFVMHEVSKFI